MIYYVDMENGRGTVMSSAYGGGTLLECIKHFFDRESSMGPDSKLKWLTVEVKEKGENHAKGKD